MSNLQVMRSFNAISQEFMSNDFDLRTVAELIARMRLHRHDLSSDQFKNLLEIPIDVLCYDVVEKDKKVKFLYSETDYFYGNMKHAARDHEYFQQFLDRMRAKDLSLNDMIAYTRYIQENPSLHDDYLLRNTEVTLREFVILSDFSNFMRSGRVFANLIDRIIGI